MLVAHKDKFQFAGKANGPLIGVMASGSGLGEVGDAPAPPFPPTNNNTSPPPNNDDENNERVVDTNEESKYDSVVSSMVFANACQVAGHDAVGFNRGRNAREGFAVRNQMRIIVSTYSILSSNCAIFTIPNIIGRQRWRCLGHKRTPAHHCRRLRDHLRRQRGD